MAPTPLTNLFLRAPEICHIAPPICLPGHWQAERAAYTPKTDPACLSMRTYLIRVMCNGRGEIHCFFFSAIKDRQHTPPSTSELRNFIDLINYPPVVREMQDKLEVHSRCTRPFSVGTIKDSPGAGSQTPEYTLNGLVYHCHCHQPFSTKCWQGASTALKHMRSISSSGMAARAAHRRRLETRV
ncbi:nuclear protein UL55 [Pteropodid alphaherpesvirus 1]|uniref:Nuclear protein UL55 n=1 Tax=Pteropodid alphaherpesvirus 1 TaxID=1343901 RepID=A0A060Q501_9ALPH|nr:nuclear protein UL55 [Pteropodid alphaherpesvirus 1]BAP00735.1 nuclear protein UL55 [Pteropodid alphaherpesvirus 1]